MLLEFTKCVVTVTSAEQSFRKLKFIKTFITSNMANSRLSFFFPFVGIFIHLSQKAMGRYTSSLRSCRPSVYLPHLDEGISLSVFPNGTSKLDGFLNRTEQFISLPNSTQTHCLTKLVFFMQQQAVTKGPVVFESSDSPRTATITPSIRPVPKSL